MNELSYRIKLESELARYVARESISPDQSVLVVGASNRDGELLWKLGLRKITLTGLSDQAEGKPEDEIRDDLASAERDTRFQYGVADVEDMDLPNGSFDIVIALEIIHHCRSPHRAICEMLRVSRDHVILYEPHDSLALLGLVTLGLSFPYELTAVSNNNYKTGGVRNSAIPNYIYRWNHRDIFKTVSSFLAEQYYSVDSRPFWDFDVPEEDLALRTHTHIGKIMRMTGPGIFLWILRLLQAILNTIPWLRSQGNKYFCGIRKDKKLRPWLEREGDNIVYKKSYR